MITVFGSLNADLVCPVEHLPAPGETVTAPAYSVVPGGKGANQALAAALAGAAVRFVGAADFVETCIVTLGAQGVAACGAGGTLRLPALTVEVVDTTAAGDAFVGGFAAALHEGAAMERALARGVVSGGLACRRLGAQSSLPAAAEIAAALRDYQA